MRKFIYFVIGVASSAIILISMVVNAPKVDIVKTSVADFYTPKKDESQDIGEVTGENSSFLEFGSYHLTGVDYDYYNDRNIVDFGKPNPAFFYKEVVKKKETAQNIENGNSSEKDSTKTDSTAAGESTKDSSDNISSNNEETQGAAAPCVSSLLLDILSELSLVDSPAAVESVLVESFSLEFPFSIFCAVSFFFTTSL